MTGTATLLQQKTVNGKRFLAAIGSAILAAAVVGGISYAAFGSMSQSVRAQAVTLLVYATLASTLCIFFRPATNGPISLRFTGEKHSSQASARSSPQLRLLSSFTTVLDRSSAVCPMLRGRLFFVQRTQAV